MKLVGSCLPWRKTSPLIRMGQAICFLFHTFPICHNGNKTSPTGTFSSVQPVCVQHKQQRAICRSLTKPKSEKKAQNHQLGLRLVNWYIKRFSSKSSMWCYLLFLEIAVVTLRNLRQRNFVINVWIFHSLAVTPGWLLDWLTLERRNDFLLPSNRFARVIFVFFLISLFIFVTKAVFKLCISPPSKIVMILFWMINIKSPFSNKFIWFFFSEIVTVMIYL